MSLDRNSAISLARVSRLFTRIADRRIYSSLDLFLPPHWGQHPLVIPHAPQSPGGEYVAWSREEASRAEERHREGLRDKVNGISRRAGERRLGLVEKVTMVQRSGAVNAMLALLDLLSSNLKELEMRAPVHHIYADDWRAADYDTFDVRALQYGLKFPALTHLILQQRSVRFAETVLLLCRAAQNLVTLDVDMHYPSDVPTWDAGVVPIPLGYDSKLEMPNLRRLRLAFQDRPGDNGNRHPLILLLESSPNLRQLCLHFTMEDINLAGDLLPMLDRMMELQDLYINIDLEEYVNWVGQDEEPELKRLVLVSECHDLDFFLYLPHLPGLEVLHIVRPDIGESLRPPAITPFCEPSPTPSMLPALSSALSGSPRLRILNSLPHLCQPADIPSLEIFSFLDALEAESDITGIVRSFTHGSDELLHARLFLDHFETADKPLSEALDVSLASDDSEVHFDYSFNGLDRKRIYSQGPVAQWQDFVDWDGYKVPLEVVKEMRLAQGAKLENWQGRGVEVGDQAWKVLTDWRENVDGENKAKEASSE